MRRTLALAVAVLSLAIVPAAGAEILVTPPAKKVCVGYNGGGIDLSVSLNHGWAPSPRLWFRVHLYNPSGRLVYSFRDRIRAADGYDVMTYTPRRTGVFRTIFQGYGWRATTFRTRVYGCRG